MIVERSLSKTPQMSRVTRSARHSRGAGMENILRKLWVPRVSIAAVAGLLLVVLTPSVGGASASGITIALPAPFVHGLAYNVDSVNMPDPLVVPRSAKNLRIELADPTLRLDTATYRVFGDNFEVRGTATLDTTSNSVVVPLPADFFQVRSDHSPIKSGDSVEDYYGVEVQASGPATGPLPPSEYDLGYYVGPGNGRSGVRVNVNFQAGPPTAATTGTLDLTLAPGEVWELGGSQAYSHNEFTWVPHKQDVYAGDTLTLVASPGHWNRNFRGEPVGSWAQVWYGNEVAHFNELTLQSVVSQDGSRITITIPQSIETYIYGDLPRIEIGTNSGPEGENTTMTFVPIEIRYRLQPPGAPTIQTVTPGTGGVALSWAAPAAGGRVDTFRIRTFSGDTVIRTQDVAGGVGEVVVAGLTNGRPYSFDVTATNAAGSGAPSARTAIATPRTEFVPPTVLRTVPTSDARSVSQTANVTTVFSEAVTNVTATSVSLRYGTTSIPAAVTYDSATRTATLNPTSTLGPDRLYSASISGIRDVAGNLLPATSWSFKTGPAPTILTKTPTSGAKSVSQTSNVSIVFSEPTTKVSGTTVSLRRAGTLVPAAVTYNASTRTAILNPSSTLAADAVYTVDVTGVLDAVGNPLVATTWSFTTGPAPSVVKTTPASGATSVGRNTSPTVTLSETITGYSSTTIRVTRASSGAVVSASLSFNSTTKMLTINPSSTLSATTKYTVTITGGSAAVRDLAGNPLPTKSWSFTTGSGL